MPEESADTPAVVVVPSTDPPLDDKTSKDEKTSKQTKKKKELIPKVKFAQLYRYATSYDIVLNVIAALAAAINGFIFPGFSLLFGALLTNFNNPSALQGDGFVETINRYALWFLLLSIVAGVTAGLEISLPILAGERIISRVRSAYFKALLRQEVAYYDTHKSQELAARLVEDTITMQGGISEKISTSIHYTVTFLGGIAVGFSSSWELTLVMMGSMPVIVVIMSFLRLSIMKAEVSMSAAYASAGDAAIETFGAIRSVLAFGGVDHEVKRYDFYLAVAEKGGLKKGIGVGAAVGALFGVMYSFYGIASYVAGFLIVNSRRENPLCYNPTTPGCFSGSTVVVTLMAVLIGSFSLGQIGPNITAFASAQAAAFKLYAVIDRVPPIDIEDESGYKPTAEAASRSVEVEFKGVSFSYPSRPTEIILNGFSLHILPGQSVAFCGSSGCGKSTLLQLIQLFYDVNTGTILVDGVDVKSWNLKALRSRMSTVSQEPSLFATTVAENIWYGVDTAVADSMSASEKDALITSAAEAAQAHAFICALPKQYSSIIGTSVSSTQLSGGQRQRVCIARALIRDPKLLCLDEATSALDTTSEREVQAAIEALMSSKSARTILMIAHRLSTIANADRIIVMSKGTILEDGSHSALLALEQGHYRRLLAMQNEGSHVAQQQPTAPTTTEASSTATADATTTTTIPSDAVSVEVKQSRASAPISNRKSGVAVQKGSASASKSSSSTSTTTSSSSSSSSSSASETSKSKEDREWEAAKAKLPAVSRLRVWALQKPEWLSLVIGLFGASVAGITQPIFSIIWSDMIVYLFSPIDSTVKSKTLEYLGYFIALGIAQVIITTMRIGGFAYAGEKLTRRLRTMAYRAMLRQEVGFFDAPSNSVGRLSARLQADAADVKGGTGEGLSLIFMAGASIIAGIVIAFVANWRLALVVCVAMPLMIAGGLLQNASFVGFSTGAAKSLEESGHVAAEAAASIKTVAAFGLQGRLQGMYEATLAAPAAAGRNKAMTSGLGQLFSGFMMFSMYSLAFYAGGQFINQGTLTFSELMRVFLAVTMSSQAAGNAIMWGPDQAKSDRAMRSVFALLDRASSADPLATDGIKAAADGASDASAASGNSASSPPLIEFRSVSFAYPTRPDQLVLDNVSFSISAGQKIALVGPSGSGKSSIVQLIERFYDPQSGEIFLNGKPLKSYNLAYLRSFFGLIQQEPSLFADSIVYNIEYGRVGPQKAVWNVGAPLEGDYKSGSDDAPPPDVLKAAQDANAATFIQGFKHGFATHCGAKSNQQLSGGQKQRVAISRAILRAPQIFLCDEATSALDTASERVVQAALDALIQPSTSASPAERKSATALVIAHRLSTIKDSDVILVLEDGCLVESGSHDALVATEGGLYKVLYEAQMHVEAQDAAKMALTD